MSREVTIVNALLTGKTVQARCECKLEMGFSKRIINKGATGNLILDKTGSRVEFVTSDNVFRFSAYLLRFFSMRIVPEEKEEKTGA